MASRTRRVYDDSQDLLVFGYSCKIFATTPATEYIAEERHLQTWLETDVRIDRFDVRMLLHSVDDIRPRNDSTTEICPTEALEEEMCEEERFKDLRPKVRRWDTVAETDQERAKKAEIHFSYDTQAPKNQSPPAAEDDSDSEDEPFEPPEGVKLPVGLECPDNQKSNHIILRTAGFVVEKGPQMEIVIKAKQRGNSEQFNFLQFDNPLNAYYKYMMKMIREKKYTVPDFAAIKQKKRALAKKKSEVNVAKTAMKNSLIADYSDSDDEDGSDTELHPLLAGSMPSSVASFGPAPAPTPPPRQPESQLHKSDSMYATLFKNLAGSNGVPKMEKPESVVASTEPPKPTLLAQEETRPPDVEFQKWWTFFYKAPCHILRPQPIIQPSDDLIESIDSYAQYCAKHGAEGEYLLRDDSRNSTEDFSFLTTDSPYHSYYQSKVRDYQRAWGIYPPKVIEEKQSLSIAEVYPCVSSNQSVDESPKMENEEPMKPLNRRARRRLMDAPRVHSPIPISIVDPIGSSACINISAPPPPPPLPSPPSGPITLIFNTKKAGCDNEILAAPEPPAVPSDLQLERKEKARLFMEKILREKQLKRKAEAEEKARLAAEAEAVLEATAAAAENGDDLEAGEISKDISDNDGERPKKRSKKERKSSKDKDVRHRRERRRSRSRSGSRTRSSRRRHHSRSRSRDRRRR